MTKPRFAHRIIIPKPYVPAEQTDIRTTFRAAQDALDEAARLRLEARVHRINHEAHHADSTLQRTDADAASVPPKEKAGAEKASAPARAEAPVLAASPLRHRFNRPLVG